MKYKKKKLKKMVAKSVGTVWCADCNEFHAPEELRVDLDGDLECCACEIILIETPDRIKEACEKRPETRMECACDEVSKYVDRVWCHGTIFQAIFQGGDTPSHWVDISDLVEKPDNCLACPEHGVNLLHRKTEDESL